VPLALPGTCSVMLHLRLPATLPAEAAQDASISLLHALPTLPLLLQHWPRSMPISCYKPAANKALWKAGDCMFPAV
jgi:hypothetical protein